MQKLFILIFLAVSIISCFKDNSASKGGSFEYTVSGSAQADVGSDNCRFGKSSTSASSFVTMHSGVVDILTFKISAEDLVPGDYMVNAGFVNGNFQPSKPGDVTGELQLGSIFSGNKFYNTSGGNGGRVTITSMEDNVIKGNFQVSMLELVGGTAGSEPNINVAGDFTAVRQ